MVRKHLPTVLIFSDYSEATVSGHVAHLDLKKCWMFENIEQLLRICEYLFDAIDMPQRTHKRRHYGSEDAFSKKAAENIPGTAKGDTTLGNFNNEHNNDDYEEIVSKTPTFIVKVMYRQNASWQGVVKWVDKGLEVKFRSALELIMLMAEALGTPLPQWETSSEKQIKEDSDGEDE